MSKTVYCPAVATLASVVTSLTGCPTEFGQIQKIVFWRRGQAFTTVASATSATVWTARLASTGDAKLLASPMLTASIPASESREAGSGNEVVNGIPIAIGSNPVKVEGRTWEQSQTVITALKAIGGEYLDVMFINESGQLLYKLVGATAAGFKIHSLWISDMATGTFTDGSYNTFSFYMEPNWSNAAAISVAFTASLNAVNA